MSKARGPVSPYEKEALEALAAAIIKEPTREKEFVKAKQDWITAYTFYRDQGIAPHQIEGQVRGIDFNHPVSVGIVPPPGQVAQYQPPTTEGKFPKAATGNYWAEPGQSPQALGISDYGKMRKPDRAWEADPSAPNVKKTAWQFEPDPSQPSVPALFSTAAPVVDNWSRRTSWDPNASVTPVICSGGGKQIFAPQGKNIFALSSPAQKAVQTRSSADIAQGAGKDSVDRVMSNRLGR